MADDAGRPFSRADDAWFWLCRCLQAKLDGARTISGLGDDYPCEPVDVELAVRRLVATGALSRDDLRVMVEYGRGGMTPEQVHHRRRQDEARWQRSMARLALELIEKGIVRRPDPAEGDGG